MQEQGPQGALPGDSGRLKSGPDQRPATMQRSEWSGSSVESEAWNLGFKPQHHGSLGSE